MDIYNVIINDPIYILMAILLALIVVFSIIKRYSKWLISAIALFVLYICYIVYIGESVPMNKDDLKEQVVKDIKMLQKSTKESIIGK